MLTSSLDWARGTAYLWSMMWDLSWGDSKAEAWNHLAAHSLTLSGGWCLLSPKTLAEAFSQNAYVPSMWPGLSHMWWLGSKRSILRERATWKMHNPSWPGPGSYVVSRLPHSINWKYLRVPRLKVRRNRCPSQCRWQGSGRAYGTRNLAVPFLENIIGHSIRAVYKFIDRGAPRMF